MNADTIEKRVEILEAEVQQLKHQAKNGQSTWLDVMAGGLENDTDFDEVVKLGRQFRDSQNNDNGT